MVGIYSIVDGKVHVAKLKTEEVVTSIRNSISFEAPVVEQQVSMREVPSRATVFTAKA